MSIVFENPNFNDPNYMIESNGLVRFDAFHADFDGRVIKKLRNEGKSGKHQLGAFNQLKAERLGFLEAFGGWGKTLVQSTLAIHDIIHSNWNMKPLVVVPQRLIADGFAKDNELIDLNGRLFCLKVHEKLNFCKNLPNVHSVQTDEERIGTASVIQGLKEWLLQSPKQLVDSFMPNGVQKATIGDVTVIEGLFAIVSYQALGLAWDQMRKHDEKFGTNQCQQAVKNLALKPDEAHHVDGVYSADIESLSEAQIEYLKNEGTWLGDICNACIKEPSASLLLTSATPFRGDKREIIHPKTRALFSIFQADFLEHYNSLGIESVQVEFNEFLDDPLEKIFKDCTSEPKHFHLVVIPSTTRFWRQLENAYHSLVLRLNDFFGEEHVLDFVPNEGRIKKRTILKNQRSKFEDTVKNGSPEIRVVITCMVGREGMDWVPCSRIHHASPEGSASLAAQTVYRMFRPFRPERKNSDFPGQGKTNVKVTYHFKKHVKVTRELLSDRVNAQFSMMLVDTFNPILFPCLPVPENSSKKTISTGATFKDIFRNQTDTVLKTLKENAIKLDLMEVKASEGRVGSDTLEVIRSAITSTLSQFPPLDEDGEPLEMSDDVLSGIRNMMERWLLRSLALAAGLKPSIVELADVSFIRKHYAFDKVFQKVVQDGFVKAFLSDLTKEDLEQLRGIVREHFGRTMYSWDQFKRVVNEFNIQSSASYQHVRKSDKLLPADPSAQYPEFGRSWDAFRGRPETLVRRRQPSLQKRYELSCVPFTKRGLTPPTLEQWVASKKQ